MLIRSALYNSGFIAALELFTGHKESWPPVNSNININPVDYLQFFFSHTIPFVAKGLKT